MGEIIIDGGNRDLGREGVAVRHEIRSEYPFPSKPVLDLTIFSRRDHYRAYP